MTTLAEIRAKYPQYNDMSDADLAAAMHQKFYKDMPLGEFRSRVGVAPVGPQPNQRRAEDRSTADLTKIDEDLRSRGRPGLGEYERGAILPFGGYVGGPTEFAVPSILKDVTDSLYKLMTADYAGREQPLDDSPTPRNDPGEDVMNLGLIGPAAVGRSATRGAKDAAKFVAGRGRTIADDEAAARLYLADRMKRNATTPGLIADDLARGQAAAKFSGGDANLPETIADVTPVTQRILRGIKVGGAADDIIEPFLSRRQAGSMDLSREAGGEGQYARISEALRLALREPEEALADRLTKLGQRQSKEARANYKAAFASPDPFDVTPVLTAYSLEAMNLVDPKQRALLSRAIRYFDPQGATGKGANFGAATLERFDKGKQALDDLIESAAAQNQYGNANNLGRLLTRMKHDLLDAVHAPSADGVPTANAAYHKARQSYATAAEIRQAAKDGAAFARGTADVTDREWRAMSEAEKGIFRASWRKEVMRSAGDKAAGPTSDFTGKLRTPNALDDLRMIMPPTAGRSSEFPGGNRDKLSELLKRESRISDTSRKVLGNSSTAEKATDAIDIGRMARVFRYIREEGGPINAASAALSSALERLTAIKGDRARYLAKQLTETEPQKVQAFLREVEKTYGKREAQRVSGVIDRWAAGIELHMASEPLVGDER